MRRASRDYTKYLRGSEEMGGGGPGAPHEGPLHAPPPPAPPAPHPPAAASRSMFVAFLGLGLGQVVCSVALFLYFRAQVSARLPGGPPTSPVPRRWETEAAVSSAPRTLQVLAGKGTLKRVRPARGQPGAGPGARASGLRARLGPAGSGAWARSSRPGAFEFPPRRSIGC